MLNISAGGAVLRIPVVCSADDFQGNRCFSNPTDNIAEKHAFSEESVPRQQAACSEPAAFVAKHMSLQQANNGTMISKSPMRQASFSTNSWKKELDNLLFSFNDIKMPIDIIRMDDAFKSNFSSAGMYYQAKELGHAALVPKSTNRLDDHGFDSDRMLIRKFGMRNLLRSNFKNNGKSSNAYYARVQASGRYGAEHVGRLSKGLDRYDSNRRSKILVSEEGTPPGEKDKSFDSQHRCVICLSELGDQRTESCCCCGAKVCPACVMARRVHLH